MTVHATFAKELVGSKNPDYRLFALFGYDDNLDPAFLNVKDRICRFSLKTTWSVSNSRIVFPSPTTARNALGSKVVLGVLFAISGLVPRCGTSTLAKMALAVRDKVLRAADIFMPSELREGNIMPRCNTESVVKIAHIPK
jgi:hypothetical protein